MKVGEGYFQSILDSSTICKFIAINSPSVLSSSNIMGRKFFVGGNWKMNGTKSEIDGIVTFLKTGPLDSNVGRFPC